MGLPGGRAFAKPGLDTVFPLESSATWPSDPPTGLVKPKRLGGYRKIKMCWPLIIGRCMDDDHTPAHSRIVRTCPRVTPAIARSTRKLNWTAGIEAGTARSMVVAGGVEPSTVPAKIIPARRESCFHCAPRTRSAMTWSDGCARAKFAPQKFHRQTFDRQTRAAIHPRPGARIKSLFLEGTGPGEVLGVESE